MKLQTGLLLSATVALAGILISTVWVNQAQTASPRAIAELAESELPQQLESTAQLASSDVGPKPYPVWNSESTETATFGTGCFWCTEALFEELDGVLAVVSGYSGGHVENPTYEDISTGLSGHAEVVQITYDPNKISFKTLLQAFWMSHDPTTLNKQGSDDGPQYRSVIFYHNELQKKLAESFKKKLTQSNAFGKPIVTEITGFDKFYEAENYHQDYFASNERVPYCEFAIKPKLKKFRKAFATMQQQKSQ